MDCDRTIRKAWEIFGSPAPSNFKQVKTYQNACRSNQSRLPSKATTTIVKSPPVAVASSEGVVVGSDSAISGSSDEDERQICRAFDYLNDEEPRRRPIRGHAVVAGATGELKHIEQHLSMKKTLRKKMMRDLRQAFVEDPSNFREEHDDSSTDHPGAFDLHRLRLATELPQESTPGATSFLTMLRHDPDSGRGSPTQDASRHAQLPLKSCTASTNSKKWPEKKSFWKKLTSVNRKPK